MNCHSIILSLLVISLPVLANNLLSPADQVCTNNDYALCSHADCQCLDEDGNEGDCEMYDFNNPDTSLKGWAQCTCPVVKHSADIAYNANYATLGCDILNHPQDLAGNPFPPFARLKDKKVDVYSTYSYGDSLNNHNYGTLKNAQLIVCDQPKRQTLCLDMPCTLSEDGKVAECYCQNAAALVAAQSCQTGQICPPQTMWNTLSNACDTNNCDPGDDKIRSAAYIYQTMIAIAGLYQVISGKDPSFKNVPGYCRND
jgi:hypothetical protein